LGLVVRGAWSLGSAGYATAREALEDRKLRREERAELLEALATAVVSAHYEAFETVRAPELREPELVDRDPIRRAYVAERLGPVPRWRLLERRRLRRLAIDSAIRECDAEDVRRRDVASQRYHRELKRWPSLQENDRDTVLAVLEEAFADNHVPAVAIDCFDSTATVAVVTGDPDLLPAERPQRDERGRLRFVARDDADSLHRDAVLSAALATAREAFAVAPFVVEARVMCLERRKRAMRRDRLVVLGLLELVRDQIPDRGWERPPLDLLAEHGVSKIEVDRGTGALCPVALDDEPLVELTLKELAGQLDCVL
jgi:hypothetical protein